MKTVSIQRYYKGFLSLRGAVAVLVGILPLSSFLPADWGIYSFPPLGDHAGLWKIITFVSVIMVTFVVLQMQYNKFVRTPKKRGKIIIPPVILAIMLGITLGMLYTLYIHRIELPTVKQTVLVSVGYQRSEFGNKPEYKQLTEREVLLKYGTNERVVEKFWDGESTIQIRVIIYLVYLFLLIILTSISCFLVLFNLTDTPESKADKQGTEEQADTI